MNIICVKIGTKYSAEYVNNLYVMCKKNITQEFNFFCYTEDAKNLRAEVTVIPFIDNNLTTIVHNKLFLFSRHIANILGADTQCVFFDLDVLIKHNIDSIVATQQAALTILEAQWKSKDWPQPIKTDYANHNHNSSMMMWIPQNNYHIWDNFNAQLSKFVLKYKGTMDAYLVHECNTNNQLASGMCRSFLYGIPTHLAEIASKNNYKLRLIKASTITVKVEKRLSTDGKGFYLKEDHPFYLLLDAIPIVLFNGTTEPQFNTQNTKMAECCLQHFKMLYTD